MQSESDARAAEGIRWALDLFEVAVDMLEQRIRRERPDASDLDVDMAVAAWLNHRPGAEHGDADGVSVSLPRR